jgi:hypothetical protein
MFVWQDRPIELKRTFLQVLVASMLATAGLAIGFLLFAEFDDTTWKIIGTTALLSGFSLLGLPGATLLDQGRAQVLGAINLLLAGAGLVLALTLLWTESDSGWKPLVFVVAFTGAAAQASGTTARRRADDPPVVRIVYLAGLGGAVLVASLISIAAWQEIERAGFYRILGALAVADLLTVLLQPILRRTARPGRPPPAKGDPFAFTCTLDVRPVELPSWATRREDHTVECRVPARDFASAVATAISDLERTGGKVLKIERL